MSTHTLIERHYPVAINSTDRAQRTAKRNRDNSQQTVGIFVAVYGPCY
jgi:hypothetical protein